MNLPPLEEGQCLLVHRHYLSMELLWINEEIESPFT